jgi:hypothetical protein
VVTDVQQTSAEVARIAFERADGARDHVVGVQHRVVIGVGDSYLGALLSCSQNAFADKPLASNTENILAQSALLRRIRCLLLMPSFLLVDEEPEYPV